MFICQYYITMDDLTPRQVELLKIIIQEYTDTAEPVGSELIEKKHNIGVSPATIRNEMVELAKKEYLKKAYFSAGRVPTTKAFRFYIKNIMREKELSTTDEVAYKSDIWDYKDEIHRLLQYATRALARKTHLLAVTSTSMGDLYYFGIEHILDQKEFWDIDRTKNLFCLFDDTIFCQNIMNEFNKIEDEIMYWFSEKDEEELASIFGEFETPDFKGVIGVLGPRRMAYDRIIPNVRYFASLIEDIINNRVQK